MDSEPDAEAIAGRLAYEARRDAALTDAEKAQRDARWDALIAVGIDPNLGDCLWLGAKTLPEKPENYLPPFSEGTRTIIRELFAGRGRGKLSIDWPDTIFWLCWRRRNSAAWDRPPVKALRKRYDFACDAGYFDLILNALPQMESLGEVERDELEKLCRSGSRKGEERRARNHGRMVSASLAATSPPDHPSHS